MAAAFLLSLRPTFIKFTNPPILFSVVTVGRGYVNGYVDYAG